jgi:FlaA1/EpsC-like NDP-sugar epimerase
VILRFTEFIMAFLHRAIAGLFASSETGGIGRLILRYRIWVNLGIHLMLFATSAIAAYAMLREAVEGMESQPEPLTSLVLLLAVRTAIFWKYDLFHGLWRYASFPDILNIIRATCIGSLLFALVGILWETVRMPERVYILDLVLCIVLAGGIRLLARNLKESLLPLARAGQFKRVILVGSLEGIQPLLKEMLSDQSARFVPVAIVDPTRENWDRGLRVNDVRVYTLPEVLEGKGRLRGLHGVVLCWPGASRRQLDDVVEALRPLQVPFQTVPHVEEILSGRVNISDIRNVEIEDLLERPAVQTDLAKIRAQLEGRVVMVTGGGGSIGSELCRQIAAFQPGKLVIVERAESSLYELRQELARDFPSLSLCASISSVNDYSGIKALMREAGVEVVYHAAAYKHVPLMEMAPVEATYNNVLGTYNVTRAAAECGVERFVMISTDKAVNPTNVMGVTKRIAEMIVRAYDVRARTRFMIVRFGNVLGSAGSVIPIFKKQIADGGPLTVTHPDMERYFMTIPEAVQLILQAACMGQGGEVFVLDMGKPVKVLHLAEKLISLSGKRPYEDVDIVFSGVRPGEKLFEELFDETEVRKNTVHPRIIMATSGRVDPEWMERRIEEIRKLVTCRDVMGLRAIFKELVPGYVDSSGSDQESPGGEAQAVLGKTRSERFAALARSTF